MRQGPTLICNCLQIKAPADGSFAFSQHNTTPSLPGGSQPACRRHPQRLISPTGRKEVGLGRGEKDVGSCLGRAGTLGVSQRAWQGVRGKVGVVPVLGVGTQKERGGHLGAGNVPMGVQYWKNCNLFYRDASPEIQDGSVEGYETEVGTKESVLFSAFLKPPT